METASKRACTAAVNVTHMVDRPKRFSRLLPRSPQAAIIPRTWARTSRIRRTGPMMMNFIVFYRHTRARTLSRFAGVDWSGVGHR